MPAELARHDDADRRATIAGEGARSTGTIGSSVPRVEVGGLLCRRPSGHRRHRSGPPFFSGGNVEPALGLAPLAVRFAKSLKTSRLAIAAVNDSDCRELASGCVAGSIESSWLAGNCRVCNLGSPGQKSACNARFQSSMTTGFPWPPMSVTKSAKAGVRYSLAFRKEIPHAPLMSRPLRIEFPRATGSGFAFCMRPAYLSLAKPRRAHEIPRTSRGLACNILRGRVLPSCIDSPSNATD